MSDYSSSVQYIPQQWIKVLNSEGRTRICNIDQIQIIGEGDMKVGYIGLRDGLTIYLAEGEFERILEWLSAPQGILTSQ